MAHILPATWNVDFALVDDMEKNVMQEKSNELGAMNSKLRWGDDEISIKTYIQIEGEENTELELNTNELMDVALGINYAQCFDLNIDLYSIDVDDVAPEEEEELRSPEEAGVNKVFVHRTS